MSKESHSFSVSVASQIGIERAIILQHLIFLQKSHPDGWVKKSNKAMKDTYPYLSEKKIRGALDWMEKDGALISEINNDRREDRTKSYFVTPAGHAYYESEPFALLANGIDKRANDNLPKGQMLSYSIIDFSSYTEALKNDYRVLEAFSLSRKIPAAKFDSYLAAWIAEISGTGETYNKPSEAVKHFLNFSSSRYRIESAPPAAPKFNRAAEIKPTYTRPTGIKSA